MPALALNASTALVQLESYRSEDDREVGLDGKLRTRHFGQGARSVPRLKGTISYPQLAEQGPGMSLSVPDAAADALVPRPPLCANLCMLHAH